MAYGQEAFNQEPDEDLTLTEVTIHHGEYQLYALLLFYRPSPRL